MDCELFYQAWQSGSATASIIITHGQGEHSGSYQRLVDALAPLKLNIYAWDLRGHGRSDGKRGVAYDFADYSRDLESFYRHLRQERGFGSLPLFFLAHSMGGLIQLKFLIGQKNLAVRAQVLSAPLLGLNLSVPFAKELAAQFMAVMAPEVTLGNEIREADLSRDAAVLKEYQTDFLRHKRISSGAYLGIVSSMKVVQEQAAQIDIPTFVQVSDHDPIVSTAAIRTFAESMKSGNCELHLYKNMKHEIYNDLGREVCYQELKKYIQSHLD